MKIQGIKFIDLYLQNRDKRMVRGVIECFRRERESGGQNREVLGE